jgi:integrase/recombinase XerC
MHTHIREFLDAKATKADKTRKFYASALRLYQHHAPDWPPTDTAINSFLAACKARGCKDGTLHDYYRALRAWLNWLEKRGKIEVNPIGLVEQPPHNRPLPRAPHAADLVRLFATIEQAAQAGRWNHVRDRALFGLIYDTGLRVGEVVSLEVADLTLRFNAGIVRGTKTDEDRAVLFNDDTAADLRAWLSIREALSLPHELTTVFASLFHGHAQRLTNSGVRQALERWCQRAGVAPIHPHQLRHAYAIHALRAGADLLDVQRELGHRNLSTTQRYTMVPDAGRRQRHAEHSPRANLAQIAAEESDDSYLLIWNQRVQKKSASTL